MALPASMVRLPVSVKMPRPLPGAMRPASVTEPVIAPVPVSMALVLMKRLLAKECVPPSNRNVAALTPLPTVNNDPFLIVLPPLVSVPPLKLTMLLAKLVA